MTTASTAGGMWISFSLKPMHCSLPPVSCSACCCTAQLSVPWRREGSRFTLANRAVDTVRREKAGRARWLKWTDKEQAKMDWLPHTRLKTARAWRMKEGLRDIYTNSNPDAAASARGLKKWLHWAQRSRLQPFKDLAKTINQHWAGILKAFYASHLHTGYVKAANSLLQANKAKACGYGTAEHFIATAFLIAGKLTHLPGNALRKVSA